MAYSASLRQAVGLVKASLVAAHLASPKPHAAHGRHDAPSTAPLVLVACSGGRDSLALAAVAQIVCGMLGLRCGAVIVNHQLQPHAAQVAQRASEQCAALGLAPVIVERVQVSADAMRHDGEEAAAREARYAAFARAYRQTGAAALLVAHTADDQAETIFMRLLRTTGIDALAGMRAHRVMSVLLECDAASKANVANDALEPDAALSPLSSMQSMLVLRPLLALRRADTTSICQSLQLTWWDDPTNGDIKSAEPTASAHEPQPLPQPLPRALPLRSRLRQEALPWLSRWSGMDVVAKLASHAEQAQLDVDFLEQCACQLANQAAIYRANDHDSDPNSNDHDPNGARCVIDTKILLKAHPALRRRALHAILRQLAIAANSDQVLAIEALITNWHGQHAVSLPRKHSAIRQKHVILICQDGQHENC